MSIDGAADKLLALLGGDDTQPGAAGTDPATTADGKPPVAADAGESEADYIEWGEGEAATRISLDDAIAAYTSRQQLEEQIGQYEQQRQQMPQEVEHALLTLSQERQRILREAEQLQQAYVPQPPPLSMLDRSSQDYDPDGYYAGLTQYQQQAQYLQQVQAQAAQQRQIMEQEQQQVQQAMIARSRQQLQQVWPEVMSSPETQTQLAELLQHAGFDPRTALSNVLDPRAYAVLKLAVQGLAAQRQGAQQVQAVRQTPRLVRGAGRSQPGQAANPQALDRLKQTGSMDDALAAIFGS
jgi:hypothetical protein